MPLWNMYLESAEVSDWFLCWYLTGRENLLRMLTMAPKAILRSNCRNFQPAQVVLGAKVDGNRLRHSCRNWR